MRRMFRVDNPPLVSARKTTLNRSASSRARTVLAIDLFAGAGGFTLAAHEEGICVLAAVESNKSACTTYTQNLVFQSTPKVYNEDIAALSPDRLMADVKMRKGECDIVMGGPPCQGYSVHRLKGQGVDDPRNELIIRYFHYVTHIFPKMFVLENVPGILWPRHRPYLERFERAAKRAGYNLFDPIVLNAKDYGVPQNRKRVFLLGIRSDIDSEGIEWPPAPSHGDPSSDEVKKGKLSPWMTAATVFKKAALKEDPNDLHMNHSKALVEVFKKTPHNGGSRNQSGRVLPCHKMHNGHKDVYGRINSKVPGPTMTTACVNPSKGRFVHPKKNHGITIREAARFQTFNDSFVFHGGLIAAAVQVGNAVPIKLGRAVLKSMVKLLPVS